MAKKFSTALLALILFSPLLAAAVPGLSLSLGPYLGSYKPSLKTFNNQVLLYEPRPAWGSAAEYGLQAKAGLPLVGLGAGINLGHWSHSDQWSTTAGPGGIYTLTNKYQIILYPLEAFADYSLPIIPMILKGRAGGALGIAWATFKSDSRRVVTTTGVEDQHNYFTARGSTSYFGLNLGLDLVAIPKFTIGADLGYRLGEIEQLEVKESNNPSDIGTLVQYYDHIRSQVLPLPLELNGLYVRLMARYHF